MSSPQNGTPLGTIINRDRIINDPIVFFQALDTDLLGGRLIYQDGNLGLKVVPITGINASRIRIIAFDSINNPGAKGLVRLDTFKKSARAVVEIADAGGIPVNSNFTWSATKAGCIEELDVADVNFNAKNLGIYLGHLGETTGINNPPTDGVDGETNAVVDFD